MDDLPPANIVDEAQRDELIRMTPQIWALDLETMEVTELENPYMGELDTSPAIAQFNRAFDAVGINVLRRLFVINPTLKCLYASDL